MQVPTHSTTMSLLPALKHKQRQEISSVCPELGLGLALPAKGKSQ